MTITAYKLKDGTWGAKAEPPVNAGDGETLEVERKDGTTYRVAVRRRLWGNEDRELYSVERLPNLTPGEPCPTCGRTVADPDAPKRHAKANGSKKAEQPSEDFDDDVPF